MWDLGKPGPAGRGPSYYGSSLSLLLGLPWAPGHPPRTVPLALPDFPQLLPTPESPPWMGTIHSMTPWYPSPHQSSALWAAEPAHFRPLTLVQASTSCLVWAIPRNKDGIVYSLISLWKQIGMRSSHDREGLREVGRYFGPLSSPRGHSPSSAVRAPPAGTLAKQDCGGLTSRWRLYPPDWGQCSSEGSCPTGIWGNSTQFQIPSLPTNTLQSLYPLLPICAKCQGDKPVFFLLGFTRWPCQFCADQSFSLFSYTFFSEVCEVILV